MAVAHKLLVIAYYILRDGTCYRDLGADYFDRLNPEGLRRRLTKRLEGLGFKVTLEPLAQVA
jgi:transposase